ncbi:MAG: hypothetical protein ACRD0W_00210 [Acidimicrobiales bacterium]
MKDFIRGAWKAIAGGVYAAASAAGIVVADLDARAIAAAFVVGALGVYFAPANQKVVGIAARRREPL